MNKNGLREFQEAHPKLEPLLTTLLRTYAGIFDVPTYISELQVAQLMHLDVEEVKSELRRAHSFAVLEYVPQNEDPQLVFRRHRVNAADFRINPGPYEARRDAFRTRVAEMIAYTTSAECRSVFINRYFGEEKPEPCGICDSCIARRKAPLTAEEFARIRERVSSAVSTEPLTIEGLQGRLKDVPREKLFSVLDFLQAEALVAVDDHGIISNGR
ncbi:MAG: hypothetical protein EOO16_18245 [Chitinophagaceae bacterium]|nr:MAG: hypothetical protein EOO16_18245 [Chitinophagaceae bacterium]